MPETNWGRKETIIWPPHSPIYTFGAVFLALILTGLFVYLRFAVALSALAPHVRVRLGISLVPEGRRLFPRLTVARNLELGAYTRTNPVEVGSSLEQVFALFPLLRDRSRQLAGTMSGIADWCSWL